MGFVARKSFKVMPGVRMTVSKSGLSASAGVRGARVSVNSKGQVRRTVGVPGTGIYQTKRIDSGARRGGPTRPVAPTSAPSASKPGLMAPKWEKELYRALQTGRFGDLAAIAHAHPVAAGLVAALDGVTAMTGGDHARALQALRYAWAYSGQVEDHPFVRSYLSASQVTITVADGVSATLPFSRGAIGLALVELEQEAGDLEAAIATAEQLDPSVLAAVSLCELYLQGNRYTDVVATTNQLTNDDDPSCLLLAFRGVALWQQGMPTAAREAFKEALKSKSRDSAVRHFALLSRARSYAGEGKKAMARKDLERVIAEDASYPGVQELMEQIGAVT